MHRILYIEPASTPGGSVVSLYYLVRGMDRSRYQPVVLLSPDNPWVGRFRALGVEVLAQNVYQRPGDTVAIKRAKQTMVSRGLQRGRWGQRLYHFAGFCWRALRQTWPQSRAIARLVRQERIDLVHTNWRIGCDRPGIIGARLAGVPCVAHMRAFEQLNGFDRALTRSVAAFICISRALEENLRAQGAHMRESVVVYNGLDPADLVAAADAAQVKGEFGFDPEAPVVAVVGRLDRWKGQDYFIEAMSQVVRDVPEVRALIVGDPEPYCLDYFEELKSLVESFGLSGRVVFAGHRSDVPRLMRAFTVLVHSSSEPEPFGRVIIEGMAVGLPVVATRAGAVPEIIEDGVSGILVSPRDPNAMAEAVISLLRDPQRVSNMGKAARRRVEELFTVRQYVAGVEQVYQQVLGVERRARGIGQTRRSAPTGLGSGWGRWLHRVRRRSWFYHEHLERVMLRDQLQDALPYASGILLDVGCGGKPYHGLFADRIVGYLGLDYPPTHLAVEEVARVAMADVYGDGAHLPIHSEAVNTVLCTQTLEHVPEPWAVMDEIARVLRPGGHLILTVPLEWGLHGEPYDFYRYTKYGLRHLAERSGLVVKYIRPRGGFWALMGQLHSTQIYGRCLAPLSRRGSNVAYAAVGLFVLPLCALSQACGSLLDRFLPDTRNTMGYIMVARKGEEGPVSLGR
ncbi:MAG: glycosyltransferase [Chloroflexota bacterium]